ncbi:hypothetical protein AB0I16_26000 [Streptomyces sp. NPDC050703]|uniref:hypothetical protein n=1 Tax=Streptomyces sp. NPDC050703 TaxID=3157218 RepID=UPI0034303AA7
MSEHHEADATPEGLASALMEKGVLSSDWLPAFKRAPRHLFVPDAIWPGTADGNHQQNRIIRSEEPRA